ncbi:uncharacterized protein BDCG_02241 [Blastomyces dermatitidis ER-3]|uniref:WHIM1 domain-containing protein n=3 Tax=Blastomyces TaxID=229219 RepID=A0A179UMI7_BLAGS|nr:uncharacterized protein BDBG_03652 [Blastomyces gilchristii SLH14081]XP_031577862.1 hypothetical protein, variant [Blastomyces gilchristii SLH14081]XP_045274517.1 uncharacterized protein BDCG_02241 [Blastomyces dermatitidis ER-3]EGE86089.1 hypothetical protein BDDG_09034 [Blastomyces dermatitidis ATCC 18188]EEQ87121.1 hypothetical protein BDCG_02241 [Blastomyces dermatitidis ER-3]OAT07611.1 hypothetical protein BDBG_03652 [Blastomyces gilchristii SLH14081]OAT07612.1 hypothetical protein, v
MSDSDSSSLSSPPSTDDETIAASVNRSMGLGKYFKPQTPAKPASPPPPKRAPSPPHEYVLADNPDIAFIVMFRSRFSDVFPKSLPHYGPQDIERGVTDTVPGDHIMRLLCALIGLCLNRKRDVERDHYQRALEEVVQTHSSQWPRSWGGKNPLHGGGSFATMTPTERLAFLKALILWALSSSDAVQAKLKASYKQTRHDDDLNQPLSVQPWGNDAYKRRYWLIEGRDDTHFRLYRESNPALKNRTWWSVAGTIPELRSVADSLAEEKSQHSKRLSEKIFTSIPRFEGSEEKRKRRDYRLARKAAFARPEPGFSLYEGRTRGKKLKYTYSDDDDDFSSDALPTRRSARQSRFSTPGEMPAGPTFTASGRQVKPRIVGAYGQSLLSGQRQESTPLLPRSVGPSGGEEGDGESEQPVSNGRRPHRSRMGRQSNGAGRHIEGYNAVDEMDEESEAASSSGNEWDGGEDNEYGDEDEEMSDAESYSPDPSDNDGNGYGTSQRSLVVQLRYGKAKRGLGSSSPTAAPNTPPNPTAGQAPGASPQPIPVKPEASEPNRQHPFAVVVSAPNDPLYQQRYHYHHQLL